MMLSLMGLPPHAFEERKRPAWQALVVDWRKRIGVEPTDEG